MKTLENGAAKLQELSLSELKTINGGTYVTIIINGQPVKIEI